MAGLGCLLIILAVVGLSVLVIIPVLPFMEDNQTIDSMLGSVLCQSGEHIQRDQYSTRSSRGGTSYSMNVYCMDARENQRDVTTTWIFLGIGAFIVPFLIGLFALIFGIMRRTVAMTSSVINQFAQQIPLNVTTPAHEALSLADRLRQLQEAHDAGMLTTEEYERKRQEILDSML